MLSYLYDMDYKYNRLTRLVRFFLFSFFYFLILDLLKIKFYGLFYLLPIRLIWSHDLEIVLNGLTRVDLGCFLCFFN